MLIVKKIRSALLYEIIEGVEWSEALFPDRTIRTLYRSCVCSKTRALGLACLLWVFGWARGGQQRRYFFTPDPLFQVLGGLMPARPKWCFSRMNERTETRTRRACNRTRRAFTFYLHINAKQMRRSKGYLFAIWRPVFLLLTAEDFKTIDLKVSPLMQVYFDGYI